MTISASRCGSPAASDASGRVTFIAECWTKVVVMTKNISSVSMTSISEITLISKSSLRVAPSRISGGFLCDRRRVARTRSARRGHAFGMRGEFVHQHDHVLLHVDDVVGDEAAEIAMEEVRRDGHAQARGRAHQRLADAAGHLERVADAGDHHREEHADQAEHGTEQAEQWRYE